MPQPAAPRAAATRRNRTTVMLLLTVFVGMVGLSFASVPLYRLFCAATGYGGTTQRADAPATRVAADTVVTVRFDADTSPDLAWEFRPMQREVQLHPGEQREIYYRVTNRSNEPITATATYNVTPTKAGIYFDKLQCFCFNEQHLKPGQSQDMGVVFFVDPEILSDPSTRDVRTITLSYTMFRAPGADRPNTAAATSSPGKTLN